MKVHYNLDNFKACRPVVTIGTFDGLHRGHKVVVSELKEIAKKRNGESVVFTFFPHPRVVTSPNETNLRLLTTKQEKIALFAQLEIDHLVVYPFTKEFSELNYTDFVKRILVDKIGVNCLVVGYDHRFGNNREGNYNDLRKCATKFNFTIERTKVLALEADNISSTKIRRALEKGDILKANNYLGYPFRLQGAVVKGRQLGRKIGFPTANIEVSNKHKIIPGYGVYAVKVDVENCNYKGMLNIGMRPTFNNNADNRSIEVNIFNFSNDIYGKEIALTFFDKIRDEKKFDDVNALIKQLEVDKKSALKILE